MPPLKLGRSVPPHDRHPVAWYQPEVLWTAARQVLSSLDQLRNRDGRESQLTPLVVIDRSQPEADGNFWFDFIADTGDGGNASYAVASAALAPELKTGGENLQTLPRGQLLLFGGDLAYPAASTEDYRYRFVEMFEAVRNDFADTMVRGRRLTLAAVPQNHDWMDSASTFSRYFVRGYDSAPLLGADIPQRQSYFCVKLPGGWWALALDFALTHDIDRDQYEQFEALAIGGHGKPALIGPEDKVVLIYPEPYWTRPIGDGADESHPKRYQRLEGLLRGRIRLRLAGDLHHYMRWDSQDLDRDGRLVTCGCGGAFTHPTHTKATTRPVRLREFDTEDCIPPEPRSATPALKVGLTGRRAKGRRFERQEATVYPGAQASRGRAWRNLFAFLPRREGGNGNVGFALLVGALYWFNAYLNSMPFSWSFKADGFQPLWVYGPGDYGSVLALWLKAMVFSPLGFLINLLMAFGCMAMGREAVDELSPDDGLTTRWTVTWGMGAVHALVHVVAVFSLEFFMHQAVSLWAGLGNRDQSLGLILHSLLVGAGVFAGGTVLGSALFGGYLALMCRLGLLTNNGYAALDGQDHKGFLRFRIDAAGELTAWFIAIDRVPRRWRRSSPPGPVWRNDDAQATAPRVHDRFSL
ncbi:hypothetical protein J2X20_002743 [Pelomonas saccharophila]|uniref:Calcineurin-like phosphoesterase domain-containing protein n=1 Tax=Roseateles saccharophilus TaxID=304 RepID=A0ABU1YML6_ROSSA|nr:hypothetical protein [Roseateles saccharophilus]MDR7270085.1 hypothetical protein [Roseateles saccharophilus]